MENTQLSQSLAAFLVTKQSEGQRQELTRLLHVNVRMEQFGLSLTEQDAQALIISRNESLRQSRRIELGQSVLEKLLYEFCDSQYLNNDNLVESIEALQDVFYLFKNETQDLMSDEELLHFMKEQFETVCAGDIGHLADTCLERMARAVRGGSRSHEQNDGKGLYEEVDEEQRWDEELYHYALHELLG